MSIVALASRSIHNFIIDSFLFIDGRFWRMLGVSLCAHLAFIISLHMVPPEAEVLEISYLDPTVIDFEPPDEIIRIEPEPPKNPTPPESTPPEGGGLGGNSNPKQPAGKNMLDVLEENQQVLAMITIDNKTGTVQSFLDKVSNDFTLPDRGIRVADNSRNIPEEVGNSRSAQMDIGIPELNLPKEVSIGERSKRLIEARMNRPQSDATDADSNRLVREALLNRLSGVKKCYERALNMNRGLEGKLTLQVVFGADGAVQNVNVLSDNLGDAEVQQCVTQVLGRAHTSAPLAAVTTVSAPYVFSAAGE